jgi:predicted nucleotidyltransferase
MGIPKDILRENKYLDKDSILIGYRGSIAHNMYVPSSDPNSIDDKDVMAVIIPEKENYYGLSNFGSRGTKELFKNEWDIVSYEFLKFVNLLYKSNPNVINLLWLSDNMYIKRTKFGNMLIENRDLFSTKKIYHSFTGYAYGQIKRMVKYNFEGYMGEKRKALVEKFGYDCKNGAHAIRLLRMGIEFLNEGVMYVDRGNKDATQLLSIKKGEWSLDQVQSEADRLFKRAETVYDNCKLPNVPIKEKVNDMCVNILEEYFKI